MPFSARAIAADALALALALASALASLAEQAATPSVSTHTATRPATPLRRPTPEPDQSLRLASAGPLSRSGAPGSVAHPAHTPGPGWESRSYPTGRRPGSDSRLLGRSTPPTSAARPSPSRCGWARRPCGTGRCSDATTWPGSDAGCLAPVGAAGRRDTLNTEASSPPKQLHTPPGRATLPVQTVH